MSRSSAKKVYPIPWLLSWQPEVRLPFDALLSEHRTKGVHKTSGQGHERVTQPWGSGYCLFGLLDNLGVPSQIVQADGSQNNQISPISGLPDKREEIKAPTCPIIHVVGPELGLGFPQIVNSSSKEEGRRAGPSIRQN